MQLEVLSCTLGSFGKGWSFLGWRQALRIVNFRDQRQDDVKFYGGVAANFTFVSLFELWFTGKVGHDEAALNLHLKNWSEEQWIETSEMK